MSFQRLLQPALLFAAVSGSTYLPRGVSQSSDWLVTSTPPARTTLTAPAAGVLALTNGLLSRTFITTPCFATVDVALASPPTTFFRGLSAEAEVTLNGSAANVGGCVGQAQFEWFDPAAAALLPDPGALTYAGHGTSAPTAPLDRKSVV
jgi:hypothetical protein